MDGTARSRWDVDADALIAVELPGELRELLREGLHQLGGPTRPTDALAELIGFESVESMHDDAARIGEAIRAGEALTRREWRCALVTLEVVFASSYYGAGDDWATVSPWDDQRTLVLLRSVQRALGGLRAPPRGEQASG